MGFRVLPRAEEHASSSPLFSCRLGRRGLGRKAGHPVSLRGRAENPRSKLSPNSGRHGTPAHDRILLCFRVLAGPFWREGPKPSIYVAGVPR